MTMTEKQFKECLLLYGTEMEYWPEDIRAEAIRAQHQPAFSALMIEQQYFDEVLLNNRRVAPASPDLADRIILAARSTARTPEVTVTAWLRELLAFVLPQPAFALATVLTLGIAIGLSVPVAHTSNNNPVIQAYFEDEGTTL